MNLHKMFPERWTKLSFLFTSLIAFYFSLTKHAGVVMWFFPFIIYCNARYRMDKRRGIVSRGG